MSYWRTRYQHDEYYYYPPYIYENDEYYVDHEPDYTSEPEAHYMEAAVESFLNIRSSPHITESNICGQLPAGAVVPVVSVVKTDENSIPWAMIKLDEDTREFLTDAGCEDLEYVFAALDYLK